jgi:Zn-finger nucleic acid-binding protein
MMMEDPMAQCPACDGDFTDETIRGITVGACAECRGVWLTAGDFERLVGAEVAMALDGWTEEPTECRYCRRPLGFSRECLGCGKLSVVHCPRGHGKMNAAIVEIGGGEFELDRCPSCRGVWIDRHERTHVEAGVPVANQPGRTVPTPAPNYRSGGAPSRSSRTSDLIRKLEERSITQVHTPFFAPEPHRWGKKEPGALVVFALFILLLGAGAMWLLGPSLSLL